MSELANAQQLHDALLEVGIEPRSLTFAEMSLLGAVIDRGGDSVQCTLMLLGKAYAAGKAAAWREAKP
jgi:hypothetical protein